MFNDAKFLLSAIQLKQFQWKLYLLFKDSCIPTIFFLQHEMIACVSWKKFINDKSLRQCKQTNTGEEKKWKIQYNFSKWISIVGEWTNKNHWLNNSDEDKTHTHKTVCEKAFGSLKYSWFISWTIYRRLMECPIWFGAWTVWCTLFKISLCP